MIKNRIKKNLKKLKPWASQNNIEAFRLYDRDIPEFPFIVDLYLDYALIYDRSKLDHKRDQVHLDILKSSLINNFKISPEKVIIKKREKHEGNSQYQKFAEKNETLVIREHQTHFEVNLFDYIDTGLFLDHRPMRQKIFQEIEKSPQMNFLNLFCYTGSISVMAAQAGARSVTSVDLSNKYLNWAQRNFKLNDLSLKGHRFIRENCLTFLKKDSTFYNMIFLDPPTFSNSKKMLSSFDVERDQEMIIDYSMKRLKPDGVLYFSNNKRSFKLIESISEKYEVKDISSLTIPIDFHDKKIHHCFEIRHL